MFETRMLPLRRIAIQGRFGAGSDNTGVVLSIIHPITLLAVIARNGKSEIVSAALNGVKNATAMWAGPDQFLVTGAPEAEIKKRVGTAASVVDQSHGRVAIRVSGPKIRSVLAKGTPVDLHADHFPVGRSAMTQIAHVGIHITRTGKDEFTILVFRGFSESFWNWLTVSAAEFGYTVL